MSLFYYVGPSGVPVVKIQSNKSDMSKTMRMIYIVSGDVPLSKWHYMVDTKIVCYSSFLTSLDAQTQGSLVKFEWYEYWVKLVN